MAEWACGAADRHRATRVSGPGANAWRASAQNPVFVCFVLQRGSHAPGVEQGYAAGAASSAIGRRCWHPNLVGIASPLRPDMIFGRDTTTSGYDFRKEHRV